MAGKASKSKGKQRRSGKGAERKETVSASTRADTLYPVGRLNRYLKQGRYAERTGSSAGAFMAAVLEYITAEILELAGDLCLEQKKKIIMPKHINLGIRSDEELNKLMTNTTITEGSMHYHVEDALLKGKKNKKSSDDE
jgi:histone H2A